jgi:hypothetical protein
VARGEVAGGAQVPGTIFRFPLIGHSIIVPTQYNVNKDWILTGEGSMFSSPPPDIRRERLIEIYNQLPEWLQDCLIEQSNLLLKKYKKEVDKDEV